MTDLHLKKVNYANPSVAAKFIRQDLKFRRTKQDCFICGKFRILTHAHHIPQVNELANLLYGFKVWHGLVTMRIIWLCPNHHAVSHMIHNHSIKDADRVAVIKQLNPGEWERFEDVERIEREAWNDIREVISTCIHARSKGEEDAS